MGKGSISRYHEKEERRLRREAEKNQRRKLLSKIESNWDAKDMSSLKGLTFGQKAMFILQSSWILNAWYEKVGLLIMIILSGWKVLNLFGFLI